MSYDPHGAPGLQDLPLEVLVDIAKYLNMADLNALRLTSKRMKDAADIAAAQEAKKIQGFLHDLRGSFDHNLHLMNAAFVTFDQLRNWATQVKAAKPPKMSSPGKKAAYKAAKAPVTKALIELASFIKDVKASASAFLHHIDALKALLGKDLQLLASVDKKDRKTKRGGKIQLTYDEIESALKLLDQTHKGTVTLIARIDNAAAALTQFGKEFSSKYAEA